MREEQYVEKYRIKNAGDWKRFCRRLNCDGGFTQQAKGRIVIKALFRLAKNWGPWRRDFIDFKGILEVVELPTCKSGTYAPTLLDIIKTYFGKMYDFRKRYPESYEELELLLRFLIENLPKSEIKELVKLWEKEKVGLTYSDFTQDSLLRLFNFVALMCGRL